MALSRAEAHAIREQAHILAIQIGVRPAARALNIPDGTVQAWSKRYGWNIKAIRPCSPNADKQPNATNAISAMQSIMAQEADRTRLAIARTSRRAFEHSDKVKDAKLHELPRAVALEKHGRNAAIAHNWTGPQTAVAVQLNVPLPDENERKELRAIDAKLDAIAERLK